MTYKLTIGLEIHCKLLTESKVFCRCRNEQDFDTLPANTHICPTCTWQPGALPILSKEVIIKAAALWKVLWCMQQEWSHFDRKSYFYPDLPMWYQITQFTKPLNINWLVTYHTLDYSESKQVHILQAHVECDTAKTAIFNGETLLDFNRAWTPLIEVVTAPEFHSADDVHGFLRELQRTLQYYSISLAEMDKWQMRCDVNISISKTDELGTKVEIKNMNSISAIKKAIAYEYERQSSVLSSGWDLQQETRWRDDTAGKSYTMRTKENALDYRYFPEPDLPPLHFTEKDSIIADGLVGETIAAKITRYSTEYGFHKEYINGILSDVAITHLFEDAIKAWFEPKTIAKYIVNYVLAFTNIWTLHISHTPFLASEFIVFLHALKDNTIPDNIAKQIITKYLETRWSMEDIIASFATSGNDIDIDSVISDVLASNQKVVDEYKNWKTTAIWFLIWQVMKKTWGVMQPQAVQAKLVEKLSS